MPFKTLQMLVFDPPNWLASMKADDPTTGPLLQVVL